MNFQKLK